MDAMMANTSSNATVKRRGESIDQPGREHAAVRSRIRKPGRQQGRRRTRSKSGTGTAPRAPRARPPEAPPSRPRGPSRRAPRQNRLAITAPNTARPSMPPTERKKCRAAVAVPTCAKGTEFCTATERVATAPPKPSPAITTWNVQATRPVFSFMVARRSMPTVMSPVLARACDPVLSAGPREKLPRHDASDHHAKQHGGQQTAADGGRDPEHHLQVEGQEQDAPVESEAGQKGEDHGHADHPIGVDPKGHDRCRGPRFEDHEHPGHRQTEGEEGDDSAARPGRGVLRPKDRASRMGTTARTSAIIPGNVQLRVHARRECAGGVDSRRHDQNRNSGQGDHEERPGPGEPVGDDAAQDRPRDGGDAVRGADEPVQLAALFGRKEVGDRRCSNRSSRFRRRCPGRRETRPPGSWTRSGPRAPSPATNTASPPTRKRLRPWMSLSLPTMGYATVAATM